MVLCCRGVKLQHGRTLTVERSGAEDTIEVRGRGGTLELKFRLTEDGIVLQLEAARISLKADRSIDLDCDSMNLHADSDIRIHGARVFIN